MGIISRIPPHYEEVDRGSGSGQSPIRVPMGWSGDISPIQYGGVSEDVESLIGFGNQEILVCSRIVNAPVNAFLKFEQNVPFANTIPGTQGYQTHMDGFIYFISGADDAGFGTGTVTVYTQRTAVLSAAPVFGGVLETNVGFQAGDFLNLTVNGASLVNPVINLGVVYMRDGQVG